MGNKNKAAPWAYIKPDGELVGAFKDEATAQNACLDLIVGFSCRYAAKTKAQRDTLLELIPIKGYKLVPVKITPISDDEEQK